MTAEALMGEIVKILSSGIVGVAEALGSGISSIVSHIFFYTPEGAATDQLSVMGIFILVFCGISLALGLFRLLLNWISGLGGGHL